MMLQVFCCEACGETKIDLSNGKGFRKFHCGAAVDVMTGKWTHGCRHYQPTIDELRQQLEQYQTLIDTQQGVIIEQRLEITGLKAYIAETEERGRQAVAQAKVTPCQ